jgi:hypothetical protein
MEFEASLLASASSRLWRDSDPFDRRRGSSDQCIDFSFWNYLNEQELLAGFFAARQPASQTNREPEYRPRSGTPYSWLN